MGRCGRKAVVLAMMLLFMINGNFGVEAAEDCSAQVVQLSPCLAYVSGQDTQPTPTCCDALKSVLVDSPTCICELVAGGKNGSSSTGLPSVNLTLVRTLPKECNVQEQVMTDEDRCPGRGAPATGSPSGPGAGSTGSPILPPSLGSSLGWALLVGVASIYTCFGSPISL